MLMVDMVDGARDSIAVIACGGEAATKKNFLAGNFPGNNLVLFPCA
jgi:hypothetical protein